MINSLRFRLLLIVLIALLPLWALEFYSGITNRSRLAAAAQDDALQIARLASAEASQRLQYLEATVSGMVMANPEVLTNPTGCGTALSDISRYIPELTGYYLIDAGKRVACESVPGIAPGPGQINFQTLQSQPSGTATAGTGTLRKIEDGLEVFDLIIQLPVGSPVMYAGLVVDASSLRSLEESVPLPPQAALLLVDSLGTILTRMPDPERWTGESLGQAGLIQEILARRSGTARFSGPDGIERIYAFAPVEDTHPAYYSAIGIPTSVVFAGSDRIFLANLALLTIITTAAAAATWFLSQNSIIRPVVKLLDASHRLEGGDLASRSGLEGKSELGKLGASFDAMAAALETRTQSLFEAEQYYRTLLETSPMGILVLDNQGIITYVNREASELMGLPPSDLAGRPAVDPSWSVLDMDGNPLDRGALIREMLDRKEQKRFTERYQFTDRTGKRRLLSVSSTVLLDSAGKPSGLLAMVDDVSEPAQRRQELEAIARLAYALRGVNSIREIYSTTIQVAATLLEAEGAMIAVVQSGSEDLVFEDGYGVWEDIGGQRLPRGMGVSSLVMESGEPYLSNDITSDPRLIMSVYSGGLKSGLCVPLASQEKTIGVLWAGRHQPFSDHDARLLSAMADISASAILRARQHEQTRRSLEKLSALHAIDLAITASLDLNISLSVVLDQVMAELKPAAAVIFVYQQQMEQLLPVANRGIDHQVESLKGLTLGDSLAGKAVIERATISIPDLSNADLSGVEISGLPLKDARAVFAIPLISKGLMRGVLELVFQSPYHPDADWLDFLDTIATQAAIALDSGLMFQQLQSALADQTHAYDATIESWAHALELRSQEGRGHSERVTRLAVELARRLGLSAGELTNYRRGVLMHDIGKMGVPEKILLKQGRLNPAEWQVIRRHPEVANELLGRIPSLHQALQVPYAHHERWNGSGYPLGLQGEEIPFPARIFAVIDVWDALTNDQPYRPAWDAQEALDYLVKNSGVLFDPRVVDAFLEIQGEGKMEYFAGS